ncbi:hypothetical protein [Nocardia sp. bgisy118]|uniref:hypothetical protein n=1 Tax=Nocardia sp. bgisy118 TaxID=3413786 RepID=UPI003F4A01DD
MFNWYVGLLAVSGVVMIAMALMENGQSKASRIINAILGPIYLGYAIYLAFIFESGSYWVFFQAFILPVLLVVDFFRNRTPRQKLTETQKAWREHQRSEQKR